MSWLDAVFGKVFDGGAAVELGGGFDFMSGLTAAYNEATKRVQIGVSVAEMLVLLGMPALPANPADDGKLLYASAGAYALATEVKIGGAFQGLQLGASPATATAAGQILTGNGFFLRSRTLGGTSVPVLGVNSSDRLQLGSATGLTDIDASVAAGGGHNWNISGVQVARLLGASFSLPFSGTAATSGSLRVAHGFNLLARNNANSGNPNVISFGAGTTDQVKVGDSTVASMRLDVATGGSFTLNVNAVALYDFSAAGLNMTTTELRFGTNPATGAKVNTANNVSIIEARNAANSADIGVVSFNATDQIVLGSATLFPSGIIYGIATSGVHDFRVNNATIVSFDANVFDMRALALRFGTANYATIGTIRHVNAFREVARNAANTTNVGILELTATDVLQIGLVTSGVAAPNMDLHVASAGTIGLWVAGVSEYVFDASRCKFATGNVLQFGATTQTGGRINVDNGVSIIEARNAANTANLPLLSTSGDVLLLGGNSDLTGLQLRVPTAASVLLYVNAVNEYAFSATAFDLLQNTLTGVNIIEIGTAPFPTLGVIRVPHAITLITGRNQANSGNINLVRFGSAANDRLTLGDSSGGATQIASTSIGLYNVTPVAQAADMVAITDSTGGVVSTTFAAITAGAGYTQADMTAVKNALASSAAQINKVRTALRNIGIMA
jgi:hypothetical protein